MPPMKEPVSKPPDDLHGDDVVVSTLAFVVSAADDDVTGDADDVTDDVSVTLADVGVAVTKVLGDVTRHTRVN